MRRLLVLVAVLLLTATAVADEEPSARAVASVAPAEGVVVGQKVVLSLRLMTRTWFTAAATLPDPDVEHAIVKRFSSTGVNATDRIDGETWTTQTWEWYVYPREPGRYEVPPLDVTIRVSGEDRKTVEIEARTEPLTFVVSEPAGAAGRAYAFAAPAFTIEERLEPDTGEWRVGESLRREIVMTVEDAPGMLLPPLAPATPSAASAYPDTPVVRDDYDRGDLTGVRVEAATYVFTREGALQLPEIRIPWWNTRTGALEEAVLEAHDLEILSNPDLDPAQLARLRGEADEASAPEADPLERLVNLLPWLLGGLVVVLAGARLVKHRLPALRRRIEEERTRRRESEAAYFEPFRAACAANDAVRADATLRTWLDRAAGPQITLEQFTRQIADDALTREVETLQQTLYAGGARTPWQGAGLADRVAGARRTMRQTLAEETRRGTRSLNPGATDTTWR